MSDESAVAKPQLATKSKPMASQVVRVGGKGLSVAKPAGAKRHSKKLRDNIQAITAPALRRLARRYKIFSLFCIYVFLGAVSSEWMARSMKPRAKCSRSSCKTWFGTL